MIQGKKVIAFTPAGRQRYMTILYPYVFRDMAAGLIDEWILFNNTYKKEDEAFVRTFAATSTKIKLIEEPGKRDAYHIATFYKHLTDREAVYVRLDDDLVYIAPHAIDRLVHARLAHPEPFLVYANIINNSRIGYLQQEAGIVSKDIGIAERAIEGPVNHKSADYPQRLHRIALDSIKAGIIETQFRMPDVVLTGEDLHTSVNCFAMLGADLIDAKDVFVPDEERFLSQFRPGAVNRPSHLVCGDAIVSHFAYYPQTAAMEKSGLLEEYKAIEI